MTTPTQGRVLVVDDTEDLAHCFRLLINLMGYDVQEAHSVQTALEIIPRFCPHVVFSDIGMPEMSGYDLAKIVTQTVTSAPFPVSVSGWGDGLTVRQSLNAGFGRHLVKPIPIDAVVAVLIKHCPA